MLLNCPVCNITLPKEKSDRCNQCGSDLTIHYKLSELEKIKASQKIEVEVGDKEKVKPESELSNIKHLPAPQSPTQTSAGNIGFNQNQTLLWIVPSIVAILIVGIFFVWNSSNQVVRESQLINMMDQKITATLDRMEKNSNQDASNKETLKVLHKSLDYFESERQEKQKTVQKLEKVIERNTELKLKLQEANFKILDLTRKLRDLSDVQEENNSADEPQDKTEIMDNQNQDTSKKVG